MAVRDIINGIIEREGGFVNDPNDPGGATRWGITEAVAREHGYTGDMADLPRQKAEAIYLQTYYRAPGYDRVAEISPLIAEELTDTGVNMGTQTATRILQRALNVLNRAASDYPDMAVDGALGPVTLDALRDFLGVRVSSGEQVLLKALNCLQGARYIELAENREASEKFVYGWLKHRVVI